MDHQFVLILKDNPDTGELDVGGAQQPEAVNWDSPAHIVGQFLKDNIDQVVAVAREEALIRRRLDSAAPKSLAMPANGVGFVRGGHSVIRVDASGVAALD